MKITPREPSMLTVSVEVHRDAPEDVSVRLEKYRSNGLVVMRGSKVLGVGGAE